MAILDCSLSACCNPIIKLTKQLRDSSWAKRMEVILLVLAAKGSVCAQEFNRSRK
jgi:hypothetical protein